jgi:hypothetical protein
MRRLALLTLAVAVCLVEVGQAGADPPADPPGPVSRFTDVFASAYMDPADGLVALGGPPPEQGCFGQGFDDPADFQIVELPSGPIKILIRDVDQPMWLYEASSIENRSSRPIRLHPLYDLTWDELESGARSLCGDGW